MVKLLVRFVIVMGSLFVEKGFANLDPANLLNPLCKSAAPALRICCTGLVNQLGRPRKSGALDLYAAAAQALHICYTGLANLLHRLCKSAARALQISCRSLANLLQEPCKFAAGALQISCRSLAN